MQHFCNSWCVRNLLVMVLRLNKSLRLAESIISVHPHQAAQAQHQLLSISTRYTPLVACRPQCQWRPHSVAPNFHPEWCSPQRAGDLNISNYMVLNAFMLHAGGIWQLAARLNEFNPPCVVNSTLTKIQSMTWTHFLRSSTLKAS